MEKPFQSHYSHFVYRNFFPLLRSFFLTAVSVVALASVVFADPTEPATGTKKYTIEVKLFDQPCKMSGPFPEKILLATHQLGPAVISIRASTPTAASEAIAKIKKATDYPSSLNLYRDHAITYLENQQKLLEILETYFKNNQLPELQKAVAGVVTKRQVRSFNRKSKSLHQQVFASSEERRESWIFLLRELGGRDPQETFHSVIQNLKIQYFCQFDAQE